MNSPARKVMVIASSTKDTGPRKGSVGYMSKENNEGNAIMYTPGLISNIGNNKIGALFFDTEIFFTKYGFERKERLERKTVICAYPVIDFSSPMNTIRPYTEQFISWLNKEFKSDKKGQTTAFWYNIFSNLDIKNTEKHVCIITPIFNPIDLKNSILEFKAWINAVLNPKYGEFIDEGNVPDETFINQILVENLHSKDQFSTIRQCCFDYDLKQNYIETLCLDAIERKKCISLIRFIDNLLGRNKLNLIRKRLNYDLNDGAFRLGSTNIDEYAIAKKLLLIIRNPVLFDLYCKSLTHHLATRGVNKIIKNIVEMFNTLSLNTTTLLNNLNN